VWSSFLFGGKALKPWLYRLLTSLIILLALARKRVGNSLGWEIRKDRAEQNRIYFDINIGFLLECCDCSLSHKLKQGEGFIDCIPERPRGYDYSWRCGQ